MTFRGLLIRLILVTLFTWFVGLFLGSFGWALYWALFLLWFYEVVRPRGPRQPQ